MTAGGVADQLCSGRRAAAGTRSTARAGGSAGIGGVAGLDVGALTWGGTGAASSAITLRGAPDTEAEGTAIVADGALTGPVFLMTRSGTFPGVGIVTGGRDCRMKGVSRVRRCGSTTAWCTARRRSPKLSRRTTVHAVHGFPEPIDNAKTGEPLIPSGHQVT